jgi:hypothetical protein
MHSYLTPSDATDLTDVEPAVLERVAAALDAAFPAPEYREEEPEDQFVKRCVRNSGVRQATAMLRAQAANASKE